MNRKHLREIERTASRIAPDASFSWATAHGHYRITAKFAGRERTFTVAGSPKNTDHTIRNAVRDITRFIKLENA